MAQLKTGGDSLLGCTKRRQFSDYKSRNRNDDEQCEPNWPEVAGGFGWKSNGGRITDEYKRGPVKGISVGVV